MPKSGIRKGKERAGKKLIMRSSQHSENDNYKNVGLGV
jgi:hypothetical protein